MLISAPESANLMDPASWTATAPLAFRHSWLEGLQPSLPSGGFLEGQHKSMPVDMHVQFGHKTPKLHMTCTRRWDLSTGSRLSGSYSAARLRSGQAGYHVYQPDS